MFKKFILSTALISMAGLVACDDSTSNSGSNELPKSVPTFMDLGDVECNADRKCETILVEEHNDTYQCDGVKQWDMLLDGIPSKICPTKDKKKTGSDETGEDDNQNPEPSASNGDSSDNNTGSSNSSEESEGGKGSANNKESSSSKATAMISCDNLPEEGQKAFGTMGEKCTEFEKGSMAASALELRCEDHGGTLGTGCPAKENKGNDNCIDKTQCDNMVKGDVSTWHFTRADDFGKPRTYTYSVDGSKLILDIDGQVYDDKYPLYDMTKEVSKEYAFSAVKSTCTNGMKIEGANYCE